MRLHDRPMIADFPATLPQVTDQFFATVELRARWLIAIEIADQANPEGNVVQIIAVNVASVNLTAPAIPHFDLAVAGRGAVADHKMISESVLHPAKMSMVIIEGGSVALTSPAVMNDNVLPATARHRSAIDLTADRRRQITITRAAAGAASSTAKYSRPETARLFIAVFFDR